jgi:hypothetical protein
VRILEEWRVGKGAAVASLRSRSVCPGKKHTNSSGSSAPPSSPSSALHCPLTRRWLMRSDGSDPSLAHIPSVDQGYLDTHSRPVEFECRQDASECAHACMITATGFLRQDPANPRSHRSRDASGCERAFVLWNRSSPPGHQITRKNQESALVVMLDVVSPSSRC